MSDNNTKLIFGAAAAGLAIATTYFLYNRSGSGDNDKTEEHIENESEQTPSHENAKSVITQPQAASNEKVQLYVHSKH
jgi:hypothetical protein